jgi:O-methyltransferase involved in polyketide biosynthesis
MPQNDTQKVQLTGAQATLLITLYAKAQDYGSRRPVLNDAKAEQLLGLIDYDFSQLPGFGSKSLLAIRARHLDDWIVEFIGSQGNVVVLNLGCGLDTRVTRIGPPQSVRWFDLDYPDVIELRRKFYSDAEKHTMLGYPLSDPDWLRRVPHDRPTMIVADGVLEYLTEAEVGSLLNRLTGTFGTVRLSLRAEATLAIAAAVSCRLAEPALPGHDSLASLRVLGSHSRVHLSA